MKNLATSADLPHVYYVDGVPAQASARYRVFNALEQLHAAGAQGTLLPQDYDPDGVFSGHGGGPAVLVIHRAPWDERLAALIEAARSHRIHVLYDIDDLVFEPIAMPWVRALSRLSDGERDIYEDQVRRHFRALKSCDAVLTTTRALASYAAAEGLPVFVHRNGLDQRSVDTAREARQARQLRDETVLYYGAGSGTHDVDFQACGLALERLLHRHRSLRLIAQGEVRLGYGLEFFGERVERWPWMPWPDYFTGVAQADINIVPLELGNPFCEVKSELKWFEAGVIGIPTVASATEAFREVIRPGENGFLAESHGRWFEILDELVSDPDRRRAVGAKAEAEVLSRYQPAEMGRQLVDLMSRIASTDNLTELAMAMADRASIPTRATTQTGPKDAGVAGPAAISVGLNCGGGSLDGLALDVTCRREDGVLDELQPGKEVAQTFHCNEANLAAIAVKAAQYGRRNACSLEMSLYGEASAPPIQQTRKSVLEATESGWVVFRFPPIADSAGKGYHFVVSSPDAGPGNACGLYHSRDSLYREGTLHANGLAGTGALVFQTFVERADAGEIRELIRPERASVIDDLIAALTQRDSELAQKDTMLTQRDALLAEKDALLGQNNALLAQKDASLSQKDAALASAEAVLAQRDQTLRDVATELEAIRHSKGYRLLKGYRAIVRRLFPPGSPLGAFYRVLVRPLGYILDMITHFRRQ